MKNLFYFIAGILLITLVSAVSKIKDYVKKGYIVKSVAGTSQYGSSWIVVLEKY